VLLLKDTCLIIPCAYFIIFAL